jgi:hypothetical protein
MITRNEVISSKWEKTILGDVVIGDDVEVKLSTEKKQIEIYIGGYLKSWCDLMAIENLPSLKQCLIELCDVIIQDAVRKQEERDENIDR